MGQALTRLIAGAPDLDLVGAACAADDPAAGRDVGTLAGVGNLGVVASPDAAAALLGADIVIDFLECERRNHGCRAGFAAQSRANERNHRARSLGQACARKSR